MQVAFCSMFHGYLDFCEIFMFHVEKKRLKRQRKEREKLPFVKCKSLRKEEILSEAEVEEIIKKADFLFPDKACMINA